MDDESQNSFDVIEGRPVRPGAATRSTCPACGTVVVVLGEGGSSGDGAVPAVDRVAWINGRRQEIRVARDALLTEDDLLWRESRRLEVERQRMRPEAPSVSSGASWTAGFRPVAATGSVWGVERVRDLLLWVGGALVALSALSLVAVLWSRDQPAGKPLLTAPRLAVILGVAMLVTAVVTRLIARRLPATAEVTATLLVALALTDWYVIRRAGMGEEMSLIGWLAIGGAAVATVAIAERLLFGLRSPLVTAPLIAVAALGLAVVPLAHARWTIAVTAALGASVWVAAASAVSHSTRWRRAREVLVISAILSACAGVVAAVAAVGELTDGSDRGVSGPAVAVLSVALPCVAALVLERRRLADADEVRDVIVGCASLAVLGAITVLLATGLSPVQSLATLAWLGGITIVVGGLHRRLGWGVVVAGSVSMVVGGALAVARTAVALFAPLGWWSARWSLPLANSARDHLTPTEPGIFHDWWWAAVAAVAAAATSTAVAALRSSRLRLPAVTVAVFAAGLTAVYLIPMAAGLSVRWVLAIELLAASGCIVVAAVADRAHPHVAAIVAGVAVVVASTASGWAIAAKGGTIAYAATIATIAAIAAAVASTRRFRRSLVAVAAAGGMATVATIVLAVTDHAAPTGLAISGTAALVVLAATTVRQMRSIETEAVGIAGLVTGVIITATSPTALAGAVTAVAIATAGGALGGGAFTSARRAYQLVLPLVTAAVIDTWLIAAGVSAVEAYTITIGASLLIAGALLRHWDNGLGTWAAYACGLAVVLLPSLVITLQRGGTIRLLALVSGSAICLMLGALRRLQAPMLIAAGILLAVAVDALGPAATGLPRWIPLGATGLLVLWVGATFERRMKNLRRVRNTIGTFH